MTCFEMHGFQARGKELTVQLWQLQLKFEYFNEPLSENALVKHFVSAAN